jgi:caffeoyl-CoA O-methyltransferase
MRPGGLVVTDNTLFHGKVVDEAATGTAAAVRAFNDHVAADPRMESVLLAISDGLTLSRKR